MKRIHSSLALFVLLSAILAGSMSSSFACSLDGKEGFLPPNTMNIPVHPERFDALGNLSGGGISQSEFNGIIGAVDKIYSPIVKSLGGNLVIRRKWTDGTVNSNAERGDGNWNVNAYGGLARYKDMTIDAYLVILCHELGHQIGGAPRMASNEWAATEGQADYWATLKCARRVLQNQPNLHALPALNAPDDVRIACRNSFPLDNNAALCIRTSMAGLTLASILADLQKATSLPAFLTPDRSVVNQTVTVDSQGQGIHPHAQCRLDTYYSGSLCTVSFSTNTDLNDPTIGSCAEEAGAKIGYRPRCWYAPGGQAGQSSSSLPNNQAVYY